MTRFLRFLFHYLIPRFVTFYYLMPKQKESNVIWVLNSPEDVGEEHRDRIVVVNTFLFLGMPLWAKIQSSKTWAE